MHRGVQPSAMIGHSLGEYVAACLAGVFSLSDALHLVALRGQLMQRCESGDMLAVMSDEATLSPLLNDDLEIAAINSPKQTVLSGPSDKVAAFEQLLTKEDHLSTLENFACLSFGDDGTRTRSFPRTVEKTDIAIPIPRHDFKPYRQVADCG